MPISRIEFTVTVHLPLSLSLIPGDANFLKFKDINIENGIPTIKEYRAKINRTQAFNISQELFYGQQEYKDHLISKSQFVEAAR